LIKSLILLLFSLKLCLKYQHIYVVIPEVKYHSRHLLEKDTISTGVFFPLTSPSCFAEEGAFAIWVKCLVADCNYL
jgi:hypothetical protein